MSNFFQPVIDYSQQLSSAHRKPAAPVGAPSLVAHFAFWQPLTEEGKKTNQNSETQPKSEWKNRADAYIRSIYATIKEMAFDTPNTELGGMPGNPDYIFLFSHAIDVKSDNFELLPQTELSKRNVKIDRYFSTRNSSIVFNFIWHQLQVSLRFDRHSEYLALTALIDLSINTDKRSSNPNDPDKFQPNDDEVYSKIIASILTLSSNVDDYRDTLKKHKSEEIHGPEWRKKFSEPHSTLYTLAWDILFSEILLSDVPASVPPTKTFETTKTLQGKLGGVFANFRGLVIGSGHPDNTSEMQYPVLQSPKWRKSGATQKSWLGPLLTEKDAGQRAKELWPFVTCEPRIPMTRTELSVSLMLNGRAIYITAVGAQPSPYLEENLNQQLDPIPAYYLVYVTTFSRWQIGRLVDTLNHLGTVRISALQELQKLNDVSDKLRPLLIPSNESGITKTQEKISEWDKLFSSGLNFRIERSRYYVEQFASGLSNLDISNIEGFQSYDKFVARRLGSTFDFINRLGIRVQRFKEDLNTAAQAFNTRESAKHTKKLVDLQLYAEFFVWFLIGPYYANGGIDHLFVHFYPKPNDSQNSNFGMIYIGIWLAFVFAGLYKVMITVGERKALKESS